jgi:hypothetical protein
MSLSSQPIARAPNDKLFGKVPFFIMAYMVLRDKPVQSLAALKRTIFFIVFYLILIIKITK